MWKSNLYNTSKLTIELRELVENGVKLWDFEYPSYYKGDEKTAFEQKVIDHYYFRQIGQETVGRFLHYFRSRIREIMPRYLDMYKTVEIMHGIEDPFGNVDVTETFEQTTEGSHTDTGRVSTSGTASASSEGSDSSTRTDHREHKMSNTPQGSINNLDSYLTEASVDDDSSIVSGSNQNESSSSSTASTSEDREGTNRETVTHTFTKKGNQGVNTYAHDMIEFRQSIIDVDMMVINELNDLFLGVY